ncbi:aminotransferase class III-fold pyridoxal phosphate-dependent enzyme [Burkholderia sp. Ac-20365]|uniref:aspartate aminotransferase family protein n=1 Tax=Burkholderia sp. Ac-20365 TaxID=2703897 RepID=UPI001F11C2B9|nr:aminotransferase class III-fold pyridoxal phosphate-dependent enzyme [Burkholderia sp. Ac-20365]
MTLTAQEPERFNGKEMNFDSDTISKDNSAQLFERARAVMPSGYTRNMLVTKPHPFYAVSADGPYIRDADGRTRIDWVNNFASLIHGHNKREVVEMISQQAARLLSATMPAEWEVRLAELLVERIPSVEQVRFMNSGTEANLIAIKAARAFSGRSKVAKLEGGYHGQYDLLEASYMPSANKWGDREHPAVLAHNAGTPNSLLDELVLFPLNDIATMREILARNASEVGTVIIDPSGLSLGAGVYAEREFLVALRETTEKLGMVLIFDEVWSLRTGYGGTQGIIDVTPDLTTMGKMIGGGLPVGAVGGKREVMSVFSVDEGEPKVKHSGTFTGNPMSMAAGFVAMSLMTPGAFDMLAAQGQRLADGLRRALADTRTQGHVVNRGSMTNVLFTESIPVDYRDLYTQQTPEVSALSAIMPKLMAAEGLHVLRNMFVGSTAISDDDVDQTISAVTRGLTAARKA